MNYTLHQLQVFLKVVKTQSVTRAAEELNLTQPAVSIQLKNLQDQFDVALTEVIGRRIFITDFGREIALAAENILEQVAAIDYRTQAYKGQISGRLKLSIVSTGKYVMPYFISDFLSQHSGVELTMDVTNKSRVIESLERNEVDFALVSILPEKLSVEKLDLLQNKLFLVGSYQTKFNKKEYTKDLFQSLPLILREKGSGTRHTMEKYLDRNRISSVNKLELTSNEAVKQAVIAGLGYSIMPLIGIKNELRNKELKIIPMKGLPIKTTWSLIWLKGKKLSPVALAMLESVKMGRTEILAKMFSWTEAY